MRTGTAPPKLGLLAQRLNLGSFDIDRKLPGPLALNAIPLPSLATGGLRGQQVRAVNPFPACAGGGIADLQDIEMLENAGADAAIIGRAIFEIPGFIEKLAEKYL